jgi:beta-aspartyl-peptidase (threonine type)
MQAIQTSTRSGRCTFFLAGLAVTLWSQAVRSAEPDKAAAAKAIAQVLEDQAAAWNKGDLKGFMAGYWKSPDLTFFSGKDRTRGWQATLERYEKRYQAEGKEMGKLTFSELDIDVLGPDSAVVRGRWKVVTSKETLGGLFTLILKKMPEGWRIVHDHTSAG